MKPAEVESRSPLRPAREPLPEGFTLQGGVYTVGPLVGVGGFSLTYQAFQGPLCLPVALKEFFPGGCLRQPEGVRAAHPWSPEQFQSALESFQREGTMIERFHHPSIVRVHGQFQENGTAYLVEELLEGETLGEGLNRAGPMPAAQALEVSLQVGQALMLVHAGGLVHSDIKPDNLFWTHDGRYVVLDFGVSRGYLSEKSAREGMLAISPGYSPPEQYDRQQKLEPASDVYALAATLYHLLVGHPPLDARRRHRGEKLLPIRTTNSTVSKEVEQAVFQGLQMDVRKRTPSIRQLLEDLGLEFSIRAAVINEFTMQSEVLAHPNGTNALVFHGDTQRLYSAGKDGRICLWSWPDLQALGQITAHAQSITALAVSPDGEYLVSGAQSGEIKLWDCRSGKELQTLVAGGPAAIRLAFHPEGALVIAAFTDGRCAMTGPALPQGASWQAHKGPVNALDVSPEGSLLATGADDRSVHLWRLPDARFLRVLSGHDKLIQSVRFSPDGRLLITGSNDLSVRLWDLNAHQEMRHLKGHRGMVWDASFTSSPELVVTVSADRCLRAFKVDSGRVIFCSEAHDGWARALAVDFELPLVATGGADGRVRVWRIPAFS